MMSCRGRSTTTRDWSSSNLTHIRCCATQRGCYKLLCSSQTPEWSILHWDRLLHLHWLCVRWMYLEVLADFEGVAVPAPLWLRNTPQCHLIVEQSLRFREGLSMETKTQVLANPHHHPFSLTGCHWQLVKKGLRNLLGSFPPLLHFLFYFVTVAVLWENGIVTWRYTSKLN